MTLTERLGMADHLFDIPDRGSRYTQKILVDFQFVNSIDEE